jgi:DNA polymerase kappa
MLDNPDLIGKPFGVGGNSVLSTASYEARKFGVRSGMATYIAKKLCPQLIVVSSHYSRYSEMSKAVMDVLRRYDPNMNPAGTDEAYLK